MTQRAAVAAGLVSVCALAAGAPPAMAGTQTLQVTAAPNAQATRPEAVTATGSVSVPSAVTVFAQAGGASCASAAGDEAARGASLVDQRTVNGSFAYTVSFTPATAGTYFICTYVDGSAGGITQHQNQAFAISVAPAPPPPAPATPAPAPAAPAPAATRCVVPALKRHTLGGARHLLALAHCKLGRVYQPSAAGIRAARRKAGGRTPTLVVVSQTPVAGTVWIAGYTVAIRLSFGPAPHRTTKKS
jgi:hypothetical protein